MWLLHVGDSGAFRWENVTDALQGDGPSPRFDHAAFVFPVTPNSDTYDKLMITGGRDVGQVLGDAHLLDLATLTWERAGLEGGVPAAPGGGACCAVVADVESVPYHKVFSFGGKRGMMSYVNGVDVLDCGSRVWSAPPLEGGCTAPVGREDTAWAYDSRTSSLLVFGGWANCWLGDLLKLNASQIIGPPYACTGATPESGPVFGGAEVTITGLRFRPGRVQVRFAADHARAEAVVDAEFVDASTLRCRTPNFEAFGACGVDVRVSINGEGWTVNHMAYTYFANTAARNCLAFGPGLLPAAGAFGLPLPFVIQARDTLNDRRSGGGDEFAVRVTGEGGKPVDGATAGVKDLGTGLYQAHYSVPLPGTYQVHVLHTELGAAEPVPIRGSPFTITTSDPWVRHRTGGAAPARRKGASLVAVGGELVLYGGDASGASVCVPAGATGEWRWSQIAAAGAAPPDRAAHSAAVWASGMVVFGGAALEPSGGELADVWWLRRQGGGWVWGVPGRHTPYVRLDAEGQPAGEPAPAAGRVGAAVAMVADELLVLGGEAGGDLAADAASADLGDRQVANWQAFQLRGEVPAPRKGAAAAASGGRVAMFGGIVQDGDGAQAACADLAVMDMVPGVSGAADCRVLRCPEGAAAGDWPAARSGASLAELAPGQLFLCGGAAADGRPLNDGWVLDVAALTWRCAYAASPDLIAPTGAMLALCDGKLFAVAGSAGSAKLDGVASLDLFGLAASYAFGERMRAEVAGLLQGLEVWAEKQGAGMELGAQPDALAANFESLLRVMDALYQVRVRKADTDLAIDQLREALGLLAGERAPGISKLEKRLEEVAQRWDGIKKAQLQVKAGLEAVQTTQAEKIRADVAAFGGRVAAARASLKARPYLSWATGAAAAYPALDAAAAAVAKLRKECDRFAELARMFELADAVEPISEQLTEARDELVAIKDVWDCAQLCELQSAAWRDTLWADIKTEEMEEGSKGFVKDVKGLSKKVREEGVFKGLDQSVKNFLVSVPLVADLRSPAMRPRHWQQLMEATGVKFDVADPSFKLDQLLALELHRFEEEVSEIVDRAQKEEKMEGGLAKLEDLWGRVAFTFAPHKEGSDVALVKMAEEDFEMLEDNQVLVQGMMANRYMATFRDAILGWNKRLMAVADVVQEFKATQNCVACCNRDGLLKFLEGQQSALEVCEKALADYMESKRRAFPRFYFVSTADLLDILSNGNSPHKVMQHMSKCFQAIDRLKLDQEAAVPGGPRPQGLGMVSCVGEEYVPFSSPLPLQGKVEGYMNDIITKMRGELRSVLKDSVAAYPGTPRDKWLFEWPSQVILVVNQIFWCQEVEQAFADLSKGNKGAMRSYNDFQVKQLTRLIEATRTSLSRADRQKVMNMITIDAHSRDMVANIADAGETAPNCFLWMCQLRSYWDAKLADCRIKICDASFPYGYEYLGNGPRLVITPLTDRIYITATQACWLCLGTAPAGPAGTGKTETTKDLSAQLGKSIYVFNCSPEMDYRTMGDIFKGLAASGSWGCFDEFNRLVPEVLSVCSVQYKCVTDAQKRKSLLPGRGLEYVDKAGTSFPAVPSWTFVAADGVEMPLEEGTSAFITMNPGYIGRAELPESLKALFRPITVVVPDRQLIMENMLMAEGFVEAKVLAKKFASLYFLLEDLLSPAKHYDWGLRAIKSVLVVAGSLLRAEAGQVEAQVLFRALRDFNIPKILAQDMVIFMGLLNDLFPGVDPPRKRDLAFEEVIRATAVEMKLAPEDDFVLRVVQLSELLAIRHCVFLMGPTGCGRTECYKVLARAIAKGTAEPVNDYLKMTNKTKVLVRDINPKSVSTQELYGFVNMATREWKDGLLSYNMRELANMPDLNPKWILLDGDLDANWVESMNSVMDDSRLLTLPSNERIRLLPHMKMIFEIRDLKFATPATATRAGILYISEGRQWSNMVQSWLDRVARHYAEKAKWKDPAAPVKWLSELFDKYVPDSILEMRCNYSHITPLGTMNLVTTLVNTLEGLLKPENLSNKADQALFEMYFVFAAIWAFGGALVEKDGVDYRRKFDKWWKATWTTVKMPGKGSVYDYYVNPKTAKFTPWAELVADVPYNSATTPMGSVFVPTPETSSLRFFLDIMVDLGKPIMFVGGAGVGKTQLVKGKLASLPEEMLSLAISFNYFTDVTSFQKVLEGPLEKKAGINYGPPGTRQLVYFVDDLNMPRLDAYETAMPISLIRQHLGWGHWFDRAKLTQKNVNNTQYVAAMNPTAGSFIINPRLQRMFMTLAVTFPGQDSLMKIYGTFLTGHLSRFKEDVQEMGTKILQAALALHDRVSSTFRKTAVNFHYEFTVRHVANVFQGLLMSAPEVVNTPAKWAKLWLHESERVYADRLVSQADLDTYNKAAVTIAKKYLAPPDVDDYYRKKDPRPLMFSHFARGLADKTYDEVPDYQHLYKVLTEALLEYNETNAVMDLVLFEDAMKHVARISRIISSPGGHALLVGVGGSGKQSLARLAAFICGYATVTIVISGNYSLSTFREDLQRMYRRAGVKGEGLMFLLTDSQIVDERMLVSVNDLLASGEVPELFAAEDRDEIVNAMRGETKSLGLADSAENCWATFINKVRANLHVAFTASPVGGAFRVRSQRFLATINSTVIDWFQPWPEASLLSVARKFLDGADLGGDAARAAIVEFMPFSFAAVNKARRGTGAGASKVFYDVERRHNYTTPKTFLELIKLYKSVLARKRKESQEAIDRLENGLAKLHKTQADVDVLVEDARKMAVEVEHKVASANVFADQVGVEKEKVAAENESAKVEADKCAAIAKEVSEKQASCEADLAAAEPLVAQAEAALDTLNKKDLGETKSLKKPPPGVDDITAVVIILLEGNPKDKSWSAATKLMNNVDKFLERLRCFKGVVDEGKIQKKTVDACRSYLDLPHFNRDVIYNKSHAAAGLCDWAVNIVKYYDVVSEVEPKRQELAVANAKLQDANTMLAAVQQKVAELNAMVQELESQFNAAVDDKNAAIREAERCQLKLQLANRLINALASEGERWARTVEQLRAGYDVLTGDMLLASAFVSYAGPFTSRFRSGLIAEWIKLLGDRGVPMTEGIKDPLSLLVDDALVASWIRQGLPSDPTSVQNGTILVNSERWPLMMDPQLQGVLWIKEREAKNGLQVVRMGADNMMAVMERAMAAGHSVLVENMGESIDAVLNPVITRSTFKKGRSLYIKLGDKDVEYNKSFRLFLHTKLSNPHYPPETQAETTLINFTVTEQGLEDQLLALVVNKERPDLEETKTQLIIQNTEFTIKLKQLEDELLYKLSTAEGDITEDVALIESLEESKRVATDINDKVVEARETEGAINDSRNKYRPVAQRGAMLFFLLNSLPKVHAFYQFSLNAFVAVYGRGLDAAPGGRRKPASVTGEPIVEGDEEGEDADYAMSPEELDVRLAALLHTCTYTVIDAAEYDALCKGARSPAPPPITDDLSRWMTEGQWAAVDALAGSGVPGFASLAKDLEKASEEWSGWCLTEAPERAPMPGDWGRVGEFRKLLLLRALRPDRITNALQAYCEGVMGPEFVKQDAFNPATVLAESSSATPIFFVLFPGYSPSKEVEAYARSVGRSPEAGNLTLISMGQGQEAPAEAVLDRYIKEGGWVFLDNVHLMQGWIPRLERKLEAAAAGAHPGFRCFFSAEPINGAPQANIIPESILQGCIKVSNEPPSDMASNMTRALAAFGPDLEARLSGPAKRAAFRSILFGLCFYHSLLLGRKKFGVGIGTGSGSGLGFCRGYSFNAGDLATCGDVLANYLEAYDAIPWDDLRYMFGEVFYGGHITDAMDRRCCTTYLQVLIRPEILPVGDLSDPGSCAPPTLELAPGFRAPLAASFDALRAHIKAALPAESPVVYGMHPNAELSLLTSLGETLFRTLADVSGGIGGASGGAASGEAAVRTSLKDYSERLPAPFNLVEVEGRVKDKSPYVVVALQEASRMNALLEEMRRGMEELQLGLDGALNMSDRMERLARGIATNSVPDAWMACMSTRVQEVLSLAAWYADVLKRYDQLAAWTAGAVAVPHSVWLPGLFNPKAFLTAVMQTYARANRLPLDVMRFVTDVTEAAPLGCYIHGLVLEGARWDREEGRLRDSAPGELHQQMPVIQVRPVTADCHDLAGYYQCPVYTNMQRANVYSPCVSTFTLRSAEGAAKWVLASVALLLQDDLA
ncbi:MAG: flagellar alpha dynein [Monoraphidium minutum]|nr:MAG: flagellar alpha dynein [Monoraphidium minutum]